MFSVIRCRIKYLCLLFLQASKTGLKLSYFRVLGLTSGEPQPTDRKHYILNNSKSASHIEISIPAHRFGKNL
ncbi:hypothetical protein KC19_VG319400 [Ceratodon purpureus]|uniref:Uncharacterized protein n=1 Tax=Ceratodon purpureus TaxID=3225 RepID=A0A8T0HWN9_CERPU|nr:hypothetical protein KC19_VG319400 [Ceratodon purpureus]